MFQEDESLNLSRYEVTRYPSLLERGYRISIPILQRNNWTRRFYILQFLFPFRVVDHFSLTLAKVT